MCGKIAPYTATPALLERLRPMARGGARSPRQQALGDDTMRGRGTGGANVSQSTAEKVAGVVGLPLSKAFTEHAKGRRQAQRGTRCSTITGCCPAYSQRLCSGVLVPENPCKRGRSTQGRRDRACRRAGRKERSKLLEGLTGCTGAVQCYHTACIVHRVPGGVRFAGCGGVM